MKGEVPGPGLRCFMMGEGGCGCVCEVRWCCGGVFGWVCGSWVGGTYLMGGWGIIQRCWNRKPAAVVLYYVDLDGLRWWEGNNSYRFPLCYRSLAARATRQLMQHPTMQHPTMQHTNFDTPHLHQYGSN
ncbi:hypothetical protein BU23DRAFT_230375 [Bimuria novae-zelandiae CBS 107.79]|uniref:Uncharacterized protein n=1 Tax=Bimuria novae-zelandiae CBS 107.79 TaxID=1447943 RepID=A0A6A5VPK0_9PLEO|nr:hypothetical protein BU23DRAFT_230375 [Bimuria novae-zelandiae CBS 107.79]